MSIGKLRSYLKKIELYEFDILTSTIKDRRKWLHKVEIEKIKTEAQLSVMSAESRAWTAENALKSVVHFMFNRKSDKSKQRIEDTVKSRHASGADCE